MGSDVSLGSSVTLGRSDCHRLPIVWYTPVSGVSRQTLPELGNKFGEHIPVDPAGGHCYRCPI